MRCKMVLNFKDEQNHQLYFGVVYDESCQENKEFFKYTPGGMISLNVVNDEVFSKMQQGKQYYVDFTPAFNEAV